jgi:hypothetical protein
LFVAAAAAVIIGCGGGGGGGNSTNSTSSTTSTTTTGSGLRVNIPTPSGFAQPPGRLEFGFLTGQGRAVGDLSLILNRVLVTDEFGSVRTDLNARIDVSLSSFSFQILALTIPVDSQDSRLFEAYTFDPTTLLQETSGADVETSCFGQDNGDGTFNSNWPPAPLAINARVFPGRSTLVPIYIDDTMFRLQSVSDNSCNNLVAVFDTNRFTELNEPPVQGFINDYIEFDISGIPSAKRPTLTSKAQKAGRMYVSGDNYALSASGHAGAFEVLTEEVGAPIVGTFREPSQLPGAVTPGTFTLEQLDPTDLFNKRKIVALQGIWREGNKVLQGFESWNLVTFPNSRDTFEQEAIMFKWSGGKVVDMFYGFLNYDSHEIHLFPVASIVNGLVDPADEVIGTVTAQFGKNDTTVTAPQLTRSGTFNITKTGALPGDAPSNGKFLVFRI